MDTPNQHNSHNEPSWPAAPEAGEMLRGEIMVDQVRLVACIWHASEGTELFHLALVRQMPTEISFHARPGCDDFATIISALPEVARDMAWTIIPADAARVTDAMN